MFDKHYVGMDVVSSENNGKYKPISRVTLMLDDGNALTSGDDTGRELIADCPHATQEMVDNLLSSLKGHVYQAFNAGAANINPAVERGDAATVDGMYGVIAQIDDNGSGYVGLSAPGEAELEDEYPAAGPMTQQFNRQIASTRSHITKTAEEIRAEVSKDFEDLNASLTITFDEIRGEVNGKIDGATAQTLIDASVGKIKLSVSSVNGTSTFTLTDTNGTISTQKLDLNVKAVNISGQLTANQIDATNLKVKAANITGTLVAGELQGEIVYLVSDGGEIVGSFTLNEASSTVDGAAKLDISAPAMAITTTSGNIYVENYHGAALYLNGPWIECGANFWPQVDNRYSLGTSSNRWVSIDLVKNPTVTSDKKKKKNISYVMDKYDRFFDGLKPSAYQLIDGERIHTGLVAQDIEELLEECGISTMEFAGFVKTEREDGTGYDYGLRYGEFVALLIDQVQKLKARVNTLEEKHGNKKTAQ